MHQWLQRSCLPSQQSTRRKAKPKLACLLQEQASFIWGTQWEERARYTELCCTNHLSNLELLWRSKFNITSSIDKAILISCRSLRHWYQSRASLHGTYTAVNLHECASFSITKSKTSPKHAYHLTYPGNIMSILFLMFLQAKKAKRQSRQNNPGWHEHVSCVWKLPAS